MHHVEITKFSYRQFPILIADVELDRFAEVLASQCKYRWKRYRLSLGWHEIEARLELTAAGEVNGFSYIVESSRTIFYTQLGMLRDISKHLQCNVVLAHFQQWDELQLLRFFHAENGSLKRMVSASVSELVDIGSKLDSERHYPLASVNPMALDAALNSIGFPLHIYTEPFAGLPGDVQIGWEGDPRDLMFPPSDIDQLIAQSRRKLDNPMPMPEMPAFQVRVRTIKEDDQWGGVTGGPGASHD